MKTKLFITTLLFSALTVFSQQTERVVCSRVLSAWDLEPDLSEINSLLSKGWTVKHQSMIGGGSSTAFLVFTLTPPPPPPPMTAEELALNAKIMREVYESKRREWLSKQPKLEK